MKSFLIVIAIILIAGCSSNTNKTSTTDSMNRINDNYLDTTISPNPDGYAPPNSKIDTSHAIEDSINASKQ